MKKKALALALLLTGASVSAQAGSDLTIKNGTNLSSTAILNGGPCSSILGSAGITNPHSTNKVSQYLLNSVCATHPDDCTAEIYMTKNCNADGAKPIATVTFSLQNGIQPITVSKDGYNLNGSGFSIVMTGGPAA